MKEVWEKGEHKYRDLVDHVDRAMMLEAADKVSKRTNLTVPGWSAISSVHPYEHPERLHPVALQALPSLRHSQAWVCVGLVGSK